MIGDLEQANAHRFIGRFKVDTDPALIERFKHATLLTDHADPTPHDVPLTLPMIWLGLAEVKAALLAALREDATRRELTLLHLRQTFQYPAPLEIGRAYWLELSMFGAESGCACRVEARVTDQNDLLRATMEGQFKIVQLQDLRT